MQIKFILQDEKNKRIFYNIICIFAMSIALIIFLSRVFHLTTDTITLPLVYNGIDAMQEAMIARSLLENGWIGEISRLGAPFGTDLYDFPPFFLQNFDLLVLKFILLFVKNPFLAINIEYLMTPFFIAFISFFVLRELKISYVIAICMSLTYSLLPYYFIRNINHLVLSMYQFVPLSVLLCIWIYQRKIFFQCNKSFFLAKKNWCAILFALLIANNGIGYYSVFTCFFLCVTALIIFIETKKMKRIIPSIIAVLFILIFFLISMLPPTVANFDRGKNPEVANRSVIEADIYGLKISQMLLPYRLPGNTKISKKIEEYRNNAPLVNENESSYLGLIGSIGFLFLLYQLLKDNKMSQNDEFFLLSRLVLFGTLLGMIGGFGSIVAVTITPLLRGYNRISVFIAFLSIVAVAKYINNIYVCRKNSKCILLICIGISILGIFLQYPKDPIARAPYMPTPPPFQSIKEHYISDKNFIEELEQILPIGSMIYQMPYHKFPESPAEEKMEDYQLLAGYAHSQNLRWSFGNIKGRTNDMWQEQVAKLPLEDRVRVISIVGFSGIYIDTRAYNPDNRKALEENLETILHTKPIVSDDQNLEFYSLDLYKKNNLSNLTEEQKANMKLRLLKTAKLVSANGFYPEEKNNEEYWRWMDNEASIVIQNDGDSYEKDIVFSAISPMSDTSILEISVNGDKLNYDISKKEQQIKVHVLMNPGKNTIVFRTNALKVEAPNESRNLYIMLKHFRIEDFLLDLRQVFLD